MSVENCCGAYDRDTCRSCPRGLADVEDLHREAERLEMEATDLRCQAAVIVGHGNLCPIRTPGHPTGRCCGAPYDCKGRRT